jgi:hypothetical protein
VVELGLHPPAAHVLIVDGKQTPHRALRSAKTAARKHIDAWLLRYPEEREQGAWPRKQVGPRYLEIVSVTGDAARRVWAAYDRQEPCPHCHDVSWRWVVCGAGTQRRACGTCEHPAYGCYCGKENCDE